MAAMLNTVPFDSARRVRQGAAAGVALLAMAVSGANTPKSPAERPNVVLVTLDTTRADRIGCYGRADAGTPNLDRLAARGVRFADAWSVVPITLPSHLSMMTGCTPVTHGVRDNGGTKFDGRIPTLAVRLAASGYRTAAVVSAPVLDSDWGMDAGFGVYEQRFDGKKERSAASATKRALEIFGSSTEPVFLWVHYFDPHREYEPPPPFAERYRDDPYQGEIASVDFELGRLLAVLDKAARKSIVVVVADHGEGLGEHGERTHGIFTYRSTLSVPFLIAGPGIPAGRVVTEPVSIVDLAPTLAELTGLPVAKLQDGVSLAPAFLKKEPAPRLRSIYFESMLPYNSYGWVAPRGVTDGRYAYIELPKREVYDLRSDPGQTKNLYSAADPLSASLTRRFERLTAGLAEHAGQGTPAILTEEQRAKLSSLGYFPGVPSGTPTPTLDPKDVVDLADRLELAMQLQRTGKADEAIAIADEIIRRNPENVRAFSVRGQALLTQKRYREAAIAFEEVVTRSPTIAIHRCDLGLSLSGAGEPAKAEAEWRKAIELEPHLAEPRASLIASYRVRGETAKAFAVAMDAAVSGAESAALDYEIGLAYATAGDVAKAERWLESALRLRPDHAQTLGKLARIAYDQGRFDEALAKYRAASEAAPRDSQFFKQIAAILLNDRKDRGGALAAYRAALEVERDPKEREQLATIIADLSRVPGE
jgi:arylsulfatase A-like enzyme/Flp pilus assembly protein TadD